jgi:hypothetical protein
MTVLATAVPSAGASEHSTMGSWDGVTCSGGFGPPNRSTYGVVFDPPTASRRLASISLPVRTSVSGSVTARGALFWMTPGSRTQPYVPPLWVGPPTTIRDSHGGFSTLTFAPTVDHPHALYWSPEYLAFVVTLAYDWSTNKPSDSCFGVVNSTPASDIEAPSDVFSFAHDPSEFASGFSTSGFLAPAFRAVFTDRIATRTNADSVLVTSTSSQNNYMRAHVTTADGHPVVAGEVFFYIESSPGLRDLICSANTDVTGAAVCGKRLTNLPASDLANIARYGYHARYLGDNDHAPSEGYAKLAP